MLHPAGVKPDGFVKKGGFQTHSDRQMEGLLDPDGLLGRTTWQKVQRGSYVKPSAYFAGGRNSASQRLEEKVAEIYACGCIPYLRPCPLMVDGEQALVGHW